MLPFHIYCQPTSCLWQGRRFYILTYYFFCFSSISAYNCRKSFLCPKDTRTLEMVVTSQSCCPSWPCFSACVVATTVVMSEVTDVFISGGRLHPYYPVSQRETFVSRSFSGKNNSTFWA